MLGVEFYLPLNSYTEVPKYLNSYTEVPQVPSNLAIKRQGLYKGNQMKMRSSEWTEIPLEWTSVLIKEEIWRQTGAKGKHHGKIKLDMG